MKILNAVEWLAQQRTLASVIRRSPLYRPARMLRAKLRERQAIPDDGTYAYLEFEDFVLAFDLKPTVDRRGIGRVSTALLEHMKGMARLVDAPVSDKPTVHFYPSIHWVPALPEHPNVVMIHDVTPLMYSDMFPSEVVQEWSGDLSNRAKSADVIVTISKASARAIGKYLKIDQEKIILNYNGVAFDPPEGGGSISTPREKFFCMVGSYDYHKNYGVVFSAFRSPLLKDYHLLVIGEMGGYAEELKDHPACDRIHLLNRIEDAELFEVLGKADALLFPSLFEGFGLPPFEAALCGTPSICSDRPAMNELFTDECIFVPFDDASAWVGAMINLAQNKNLQNELASKAAKNAEHYSWAKSAARLVEICRSRALAENT